MAKVVHSTYYKIRNRVTGLFTAANQRHAFKWNGRGKLFRSKRDLLRFLIRAGEIPREWEIVPVELIERHDNIMKAVSYFEVWKSSRPGEARRQQKKEEARMHAENRDHAGDDVGDKPRSGTGG